MRMSAKVCDNGTYYCRVHSLTTYLPYTAVFQNVLQGSLAGRTRILVTHALHFIPSCDFILTVVDGRIAERGTYDELMANDGAFAKFQREFGGQEVEEEEEEAEIEAVEGKDTEEKKAKVFNGGKQLMQIEERNTGAISGNCESYDIIS